MSLMETPLSRSLARRPPAAHSLTDPGPHFLARYWRTFQKMDLYEFCRIVGDEEESFEFLQATGLIRQDPPGDAR